MDTATGGCSPASVKSPSLFASKPLSVWSVPPLIVVEPLPAPSDAVQVLDTLVAVKTSWPLVFTDWMLAELVTDPLGPVVPWVLTVSWPELKKMAGPICTRPVC